MDSKNETELASDSHRRRQLFMRPVVRGRSAGDPAALHLARPLGGAVALAGALVFVASVGAQSLPEFDFAQPSGAQGWVAQTISPNWPRRPTVWS